MNPKPAITVSSRDLERLEAVLATLPFDAPARTRLQAELDRADVVAPERVPANVVTMNSIVRFRAAIKEAIETHGRTIFSHGVMNWSPTDHWGYTKETGVLLKVQDGKFVVEPI